MSKMVVDICGENCLNNMIAVDIIMMAARLRVATVYYEYPKVC